MVSWYFIDYDCNPPTSTWQDPRLVNSVSTGPLQYPRFPTIDTREDADWLARRFGGLEAHLEHREGLRGPVEAEIGRERKEFKELQEAIKVTQKASTLANEAVILHDLDKFELAQQDMIKARGVLDRLSHNATLRSATVPPTLQNYQGATRGFEVDPALLRPRTYYSDTSPPLAYPIDMANGASNTFRGRLMAKMNKPRVPANVYMPTAYPLPPHAKYRASTTPTPYAIPEFCFAWDMVLRSRRDPTSRLR
jgi:hypothetical protein